MWPRDISPVSQTLWPRGRHTTGQQGGEVPPSQEAHTRRDRQTRQPSPAIPLLTLSRYNPDGQEGPARRPASRARAAFDEPEPLTTSCQGLVLHRQTRERGWTAGSNAPLVATFGPLSRWVRPDVPRTGGRRDRLTRLTPTARVTQRQIGAFRLSPAKTYTPTPGQTPLGDIRVFLCRHTQKAGSSGTVHAPGRDRDSWSGPEYDQTYPRWTGRSVTDARAQAERATARQRERGHTGGPSAEGAPRSMYICTQRENQPDPDGREIAPRSRRFHPLGYARTPTGGQT